MQCQIVKKGSAKAKAPSKAAAAGPPAEFNLVDNGDQTFDVRGVDAAGNQTDISGVATLAATSDDPKVVTADVPSPMKFGVHTPTAPAPAVGAKTAVHVTATWTDGSVGPFTLDVDFTITGGPAGGLVAVPGPVTVH